MTTIPTIKLINGVTMPTLGFGVFQVPDHDQAKQAVAQALTAGYRLIDTAAAYQNEAAVGEAIHESGIPRDQIFLTSKLWVSDFTYRRAKAGIDTSLRKLGLDYLDLYLLHQPYGDTVGAWRALQEAQQAGKIRAIGVSNFYADQLQDLILTTGITPAVNQIEVNPWYQQANEVAFDQSADVRVEAWAPFAEGKNGIFTNDTLVEIGAKYGKSSGQVMLRWLLQRGITVIPKSVHQARMVENLAVFDFHLSDDDMTAIAALDTGASQFFDHRDPETIAQIFGASLKHLHD